MRRLAFRVTVVGLVLAAAVVQAATPGFTEEGRRLAKEFIRDLADSKQPKFDNTMTRSYATLYLRRAYMLDPEPAEVLAKELQKREYRLRDKQRLQYFAWSLDAVARGAALIDVKTTIVTILGESMYNDADKAYYVEVLLKGASRNASPLPIVQMMAKASEDGTVGRRLRDLVSWSMGQVGRGEDPAYIKQIYDAVAAVSPIARARSDFLSKCYAQVEKRVPPRALANAVTQLAGKFESITLLEEKLNRVLLLYRSGKSFKEALNAVVPPPKKEAGKVP